VVLGACRRERLDAIASDIKAAGGEATVATVDVARRADVMINNAGLMPLSRLDQGKVDDWERMIDINLKGVLYGIAAALPIMQRQRSGHIINIASTAGLRVRPSMAVYSATKFAVRAISEGLRQEATDYNIKWT
jgi:NADP-dependent 3-hydroxy acid dehydrogenase YdfG